MKIVVSTFDKKFEDIKKYQLFVKDELHASCLYIKMNDEEFWNTLSLESCKLVSFSLHDSVVPVEITSVEVKGVDL